MVSVFLYLFAIAIAFGIDVGSFHTIRYFGWLDIGPANLVALVTGSIVLFLLNRFLAFARPANQRPDILKEFIKFVIFDITAIFVLTGALIIVIWVLSIEGPGIYETLAKIMVQVFFMPITYLVQKRWVFVHI